MDSRRRGLPSSSLLRLMPVERHRLHERLKRLSRILAALPEIVVVEERLSCQSGSWLGHCRRQILVASTIEFGSTNGSRSFGSKTCFVARVPSPLSPTASTRTSWRNASSSLASPSESPITDEAQALGSSGLLHFAQHSRQALGTFDGVGHCLERLVSWSSEHGCSRLRPWPGSSRSLPRARRLFAPMWEG